ncbi:hypothetical protein L3X38_026901 [Prunus dulcis]|uniref:Uncharacterized protein n=1 Tax=Prunus dulcis TaxID=3755 RepID=A0AAD4YZV3_PRUDU|nr:hypothetical protein L3X38_026901 [Prunus dulcis]
MHTKELLSHYFTLHTILTVKSRTFFIPFTPRTIPTIKNQILIAPSKPTDLPQLFPNRTTQISEVSRSSFYTQPDPQPIGTDPSTFCSDLSLSQSLSSPTITCHGRRYPPPPPQISPKG